MSQLLREARLGTSHSHPDFGILASKETRRSQSPVKLPGKARRVAQVSTRPCWVSRAVGGHREVGVLGP